MKKVVDKVMTVFIGVCATIAVIIVAFGVADALYTRQVETYTEGYEITRMEISKKHVNLGYICARNDNDSTTLMVDLDTFAGYEEGEVVEVEVEVREHPLSGDTYKEHTLIK